MYKPIKKYQPGGAKKISQDDIQPVYSDIRPFLFQQNINQEEELKKQQFAAEELAKRKYIGPAKKSTAEDDKRRYELNKQYALKTGSKFNYKTGDVANPNDKTAKGSDWGYVNTPALVQTAAMATPTGQNYEAGKIGADLFVNMNPITAPITSSGRLAQLAVGQNPYGFNSDGIVSNILPTLGALGDVAGMGSFKMLPGAKQVLTAPSKALTQSMESGLLSNTYKLNPFANKVAPWLKIPENANKSFRVAGLDALKDFQNTGVLRSQRIIPENATFAQKVAARTTGFPSFQKGYADLHYLPEEGGVIFETSLPTFKRGEINPVTGEVIGGRHYAHRVINPETGGAMTKIPASEIKAYRSKPHWLRGYKEVPKPTTVEDLVDLYRVQEKGAKTFAQLAAEGKIPKVFNNPEVLARKAAEEKHFGQWFTNDKADIDWYMKDREFTNPEIIHLRVPKSKLSQYQNYDKTLSRAPEREFVIPHEEQKIYKQKEGGIIKDNRGQWAHPSSVGFTYARTQGIPYEQPTMQKSGTIPKYQLAGTKKINPEDIAPIYSDVKPFLFQQQINQIEALKRQQEEAAYQKLRTSSATKLYKDKELRNLAKKPISSLPKHIKNALNEQESEEFGIKMHPNFNPNIPVNQQLNLNNDNSLRTTLLRGRNKLVNSGNGVTNFATSLLTAPGSGFSNMVFDAPKRYFNSNQSVLENVGNFAFDALDIATPILPGVVSAANNTIKSGFKQLAKQFGKKEVENILTTPKKVWWDGKKYVDQPPHSESITRGYIDYSQEPGFRRRNPNFNNEKYVNYAGKFGIGSREITDESLRPFLSDPNTPLFQQGGYSTQGYKQNSPDRFNPYNVIPSGRITMKNVPHNILGIDELGNQKLMTPGNEYQFEGNQVLEIPMHKMPNGKLMKNNMMQQGGITESNEWLQNWYKNRKIENSYLQGALDLDRTDLVRRAYENTPVENVNNIDRTPQITGQYRKYPKNNKEIILLTKKAQPHTYLHEKNHQINDFNSYTNTTNSEVISQNLRPKDQVSGIYNKKYDYFSNPKEIHSRLQVLRNKAGFQPDKKVTKEELSNYLHNIYKGDVDNINDLGNMTDENQLLELLNSTTSLNKQSLPIAQEGGRTMTTNDPNRYKSFTDSVFSYNWGNTLLKNYKKIAGDDVINLKRGSVYDKTIRAKVKPEYLKDNIDKVNINQLRPLMDQFQKRANKSIKPIDYEIFISNPDNMAKDLLTGRSFLNIFGAAKRIPGAKIPLWKKPEVNVTYDPNYKEPVVQKKELRNTIRKNSIPVNKTGVKKQIVPVEPTIIQKEEVVIPTQSNILQYQMKGNIPVYGPSNAFIGMLDNKNNFYPDYEGMAKRTNVNNTDSQLINNQEQLLKYLANKGAGQVKIQPKLQQGGIIHAPELKGYFKKKINLIYIK